jgi:hypothetical protein
VWPIDTLSYTEANDTDETRTHIFCPSEEKSSFIANKVLSPKNP